MTSSAGAPAGAPIDAVQHPAIVRGEPEEDAVAAIRLTNVSKVYGRGSSAVLALRDVNLSVAPRELCCLVGVSGCGKSTLLSLVSGLETPAAGHISVTDRKVALVFQEPALFPWRTASENIELALKLRGIPRAARRDQARQLLAAVHLSDVADRRPHELSGGMRQRVALARTLAQETTVLCMDEPFAALDAMTRDALHDELERLWASRGLTILFVTHNVREAVRLADRVVLLASRPGRIVTEFTIDLPRPRRIESAEVSELAAMITARLAAEVNGHGR